MNKSPLHIVSQNLKTGWSINFPIKKTCQPTSICHKFCYAKKGRLNMPSSLDRQSKVYQTFQTENAEDLADAIVKGCERKQLSFLRWAGSGDLDEKSVEVLNIATQESPKTKHWVVTRKPKLVELINPAENLFLMFSLDSDSLSRKEKVDKIDHPRQYYSYLRQTPEECTMGSSIVFNLSQKKKYLPTVGKSVCPVDAGKIKTKNACSKCRKCFNQEFLKLR